MDISLEGSGLSYQPGDSLSIMPENDALLVDSLLKRLQLDPERQFELTARDGGATGLLSHLGCPCTIRQALMKGCDLTSAPRYWLQKKQSMEMTSVSARLWKGVSKEWIHLDTSQCQELILKPLNKEGRMVCGMI